MGNFLFERGRVCKRSRDDGQSEKTEKPLREARSPARARRPAPYRSASSVIAEHDQLVVLLDGNVNVGLIAFKQNHPPTRLHVAERNGGILSLLRQGGIHRRVVYGAD